MEGARIEASLDLAAQRGGDITARVYARLFARHPDMEAQFVRDTDGAVRGEMLARTIETILDLTGPRSFGENMLRTEIVTHDGYGVPPAVFPVFFTVLAECVRELCGPAWDEPTDREWAALLAQIGALTARD